MNLFKWFKRNKDVPDYRTITDEVEFNKDGVPKEHPFRDREFKPHEQKEIQAEFQKFVQYFDLDHKGWEYFRQMLVDGEVFFEHVIHEDHKKAGILGIIQIPSDLVDPIYDNVQNLTIKGFLLHHVPRPFIQNMDLEISKS